MTACGCGHPLHVGLCPGTLATVDDGDLVAHEIAIGRDPAEPCVCDAPAPFMVFRDAPEDPDGPERIDETAAGYPTPEAAIARADHAARGEYATARLYVVDAHRLERYERRGTIDG